MTIIEIKSELVFKTLSDGVPVICIDFRKGEYVDLSGQSVNNILRLISSDACLFFTAKENE